MKQLLQSVANQITTEVLSTAKDPSNCQDRTLYKNEQRPIDFKIDDNEMSTMVKTNETIKKKKS